MLTVNHERPRQPNRNLHRANEMLHVAVGHMRVERVLLDVMVLCAAVCFDEVLACGNSLGRIVVVA